MIHSFHYPELELAREDMRRQSSLYQPSEFWNEASEQTVDEICQFGVENIRTLKKPLGFFAPTYGMPGNGFTAAQMEEIEGGFEERYPEKKKQSQMLRHHLSGEAQALADFRVLLAAEDISRLPHLNAFSESNYGRPVEHFEFEGRRFSRSALIYLLGLAFLKRHLRCDVPRVVMEIGGGFGTLGEVMAAGGIENFRYIDLDIPPTSFVAQSYFGEDYDDFLMNYDLIATNVYPFGYRTVDGFHSELRLYKRR